MPGEGYRTPTLDEVSDDCFKPLNVPVCAGAQFGRQEKTERSLPIDLPVEIDADAGTLRLLQDAVS